MRKSNTQNQWITNLNLTNQDRLNVRYNEEINNFIILQAMNLLQKSTLLSPLNPVVCILTGYSYCPSASVQITHT